MWLFTTEGMVTVEKIMELKNTLLLRAETIDPLNYLVTRFGTELTYTTPHVSSDDQGPAFQLVCNKNKLAFCIGRMVADIDYSNLKAAVAEDDLDPDYYEALVAVEKRMKESVE